MFLKFLLVLLLIVFYINNQFAAPRIGIDVPAIEFGDVESNSKLVREVRIANSGDEQLSVSRVKACCGANASLAETTIASEPLPFSVSSSTPVPSRVPFVRR